MTGGGVLTSGGSRSSVPSVPEPGVRFLYIPASNLAAMRRFYSDHLGLAEVWFEAAEGVAYDCDGLQFTVLLDAVPAPTPNGWATQPGWTGDTVGMISWSVVLSEAAFRRAVAVLSASEADCLHDLPQWVGYWSFPAKDPMGNTVELSWPAETPQPDRWEH